MFALFKQDVQRWIEPGMVADPSLVTFKTAVKLLFRHMPLRAIFLYRLSYWCHAKRVRLMPSFLLRLISLFYGLEITVTQEIGGGLYIAHPYGTVIMPERIGKNCSIISNVTIGLRNERSFPVIGDNVFIGAGARILGGICIGDRVKVGANAVVIQDVPDDVTVVGIPAKVIGSAEYELI